MKFTREYKIKFNPVEFRKEKPRRTVYEQLKATARLKEENLVGKKASE